MEPLLRESTQWVDDDGVRVFTTNAWVGHKARRIVVGEMGAIIARHDAGDVRPNDNAALISGATAAGRLSALYRANLRYALEGCTGAVDPYRLQLEEQAAVGLPLDPADSERLALVQQRFPGVIGVGAQAAPGTVPSYCCECDSGEGGCDHGGPRYLPRVLYRKTGETDYRQPIWAVEPADRERMEAGSGYMRGSAPAPTSVVAIDVLQELVEQRTYLDERLNDLLRDAYATDALGTSRAVESACDAYDQERVRSLGGFLAKQLTAVVKRGLRATE